MGGAKTEDEFKDGSDPTVLIVVAGQSGVGDRGEEGDHDSLERQV